MTDKNYIRLTYGIESIQQKVVVEIFGFEKSFFKSVLVRFVTNFFEAEHLIPLESFEDFFVEIKNHIQDTLHHLHDIMIELELIDTGVDYPNS